MAQKALSERQLEFCRQYVLDFVGSKAAIRAGYAERGADVTATRLLQDPRIQAEIARLTAKKADRADIQADEIVGKLAAIARADIRDVVEWGYEQQTTGDGVVHSVPFVRPKYSDELPPEISAAIAEVSMSEKGVFKVKMHDRSAALDKLMRHLGLYEKDNKQQGDALAELIESVQGTALPVATRSKPKAGEGGNE